MIDLSIAKAYGQDIAVAVNRVRSEAIEHVQRLRDLDIYDPVGNVGYAIAVASDIANVLGTSVDFGGMTAAVGFVGKVIDAYVGRLMDGVDRKMDDERKALGAGQRAVVEALKSEAGPWQVALRRADFKGDATFTNYRAVLLPGVLSETEQLALPMDRKSGCYRQQPAVKGEGRKAQGSDLAAYKAGGGTWRLWPAFYPLVFNTRRLFFIESGISLVDREAASKMASLCGAAFDMPDHMSQDGRQVAAMLRHFLAWAKPLTDYVRPLGEGPERPPGYDDGVRNFYWNPDGTIRVQDPVWVPPSPRFDSAGYEVEHGVNWQDPETGESCGCSVRAYNHVVMTCARFFAAREVVLRNYSAWPPKTREAARVSPDPVVRAAAKLPIRVGKGATSTRPGPGPQAVPKKPQPVAEKATLVLPTKPQRVGRDQTPLAHVLAAPDMLELKRRLVAWSK